MPDPFDELLDPEQLAKAPREEDAEARIAKARRIAATNDRLSAAGEIADGTGKPASCRARSKAQPRAQDRHAMSRTCAPAQS